MFLNRVGVPLPLALILVWAGPLHAAATPPVLTDHINAVPRKAHLATKRLELSTFAGISLNDPFYYHASWSGSAIYHPHDAFGVGLGVDYLYAHAKSGRVDDVRRSRTAVLATFDLPTLFAHLDAYWTPVMGKVSLFDAAIVHFDLYATGGVGVATAWDGRAPVAFNLGLGQHYTVAQWLSLRFEVRDHIFVDIQEANGLARSSVQSYVMFLAGASLWVPPSFEYTVQ